MYLVIFVFVLFILFLALTCDKKSGYVSAYTTPKLFEQDVRRQSKPIKNPKHVISDGVYLGPNTDGYKYIGSDPLLQEISPRAHRYDVDEKESLKYWDLYHRRNKNYTYGMMPPNDYSDNDPYLILTT